MQGMHLIEIPIQVRGCFFYNSVYCFHELILLFIQEEVLCGESPGLYAGQTQIWSRQISVSSHRAIAEVVILDTVQCSQETYSSCISFRSRCLAGVNVIFCLQPLGPTINMPHTFKESQQEACKRSKAICELQEIESECSGGIPMSVLCTKCTLSKEAKHQGPEKGTGTRVSQPQCLVSTEFPPCKSVP